MQTAKTISLRANGLTFSALEQGQGPLVLCLHGFPDHNRSFRHQMPALAEAGYRVIAPMSRGYEPSSQPVNGNYHIAKIAKDVVGWLNHLEVDTAHLVGHDWGAVIGYAAAALAPDRVESLTTLAVPHLRNMPAGLRKVPLQVRKSWYMFFFQLRFLADFLVESKDFAFVEKLWRDWSPGWAWEPEEMAALKRTFGQPGVKKASLGYYRALFAPLSRGGLETLKLLRTRLQVPTLALTGELDGCMDTRLYDEVMREEDFPAGLRVVRVKGAGHFLHQEKPAEVTSLLLEWLHDNA